MTKKQQNKEARLQWRRWLAEGHVVELTVGTLRTLTGCPTKELVQATIDEATRDGVRASVYVVSLEEQAAKAGLAAVPAEWRS